MIDDDAKKTLCIKISAKSHFNLKMIALQENMTQSAVMEKMIAEYKTTDERAEVEKSAKKAAARKAARAVK